MGAGGPFAFVQFEFGFELGPREGRFLVRAAPEEAPERVLVIAVLGAPERRRLAGRRGTLVREGQPEPVPTTRVTVIAPEPLADARGWLERVRAGGAPDAEVDAALGVVNRALHAHRTSWADPYARDVTAGQALVTRIGYGAGDAVAEGRYDEAWELPRGRPATRRSMEAPEERFAALLAGRESALVSEELVLRARADLDAGRTREAAPQARVALEALLAELDDAERRAALEGDREQVEKAVAAALRGAVPAELFEALRGAVSRMEAALRARRLRGAAGPGR